MKTVTTQRETRLDILAAELLGTERDGAVESLLAANPGLAWQGLYIAEGTVLSVPAPPARQAQRAAPVDVWE